MASKPVPATKKPTTATDNAQEPIITTIKKASCPNLSLTGTIGHEISRTESGVVIIGLTSSTGSGYYSKAKISLDDAIAALQAFEKKYPLTSLALKDVYPPHTSCNSWSMLMGVLLAEKLVEPHPDHPRRFKLCDPATVQEWKAQHSATRKAKPKVKAKAATRMPKAKAKPATGK
jgi:hypothetical protein